MVGDVSRDHASGTCFQKTEVSVLVDVELLRAEKGLPVSRTTLCTLHVTQQLVVVLRTLRKAVTDVTGV